MRLGFVHGLPRPAVLAEWLDGRRAERVDAVLRGRPGAVRVVGEACALLLAPDRASSSSSSSGPSSGPSGPSGPSAAGAAAALERATRELLADLRADRGDGAAGVGGALRGALASATRLLDGAVHSERDELLDRDAFPRGWKRYSMRLLDRVNASLGAYPAWAAAVVQALDGAARAPGRPAAPPHVHDLAAGTGGFLRWLATHPPADLALRLTSSDLDPGYVALGAEAARRDGLAVEFAVRDALDLRDLTDVDLFLCTQAAHHLPPGALVRLLSQAMAAAPRGVLVVDLHRSAAVALAAAVALPLLAPFPPLVVDGVQSVRRSYTPAELTLFARLAGATTIEARPFGPAHALLHARRAASSLT